jgi:hypothetical protein
MGIGVETSRLGRRAAELATGAVRHDAHKDEDHADDAEQMSRLFRAEAVVPGVLAGRKVHDHVESAGGDHEQQSDPTQGREGRRLQDELSAGFYRQHALVIHARQWRVKSIGNERV